MKSFTWAILSVIPANQNSLYILHVQYFLYPHIASCLILVILDSTLS